MIRGGNDTFFQSVPSLSVIPAKAGIQELIDNLSVVDKQNIKHEQLLKTKDDFKRKDGTYALLSPGVVVNYLTIIRGGHAYE